MDRPTDEINELGNAIEGTMRAIDSIVLYLRGRDEASWEKGLDAGHTAHYLEEARAALQKARDIHLIGWPEPPTT